MDIIQIEGRGFRYIIKVKDNLLSGYKFYGERFCGPIDDKIFKHFNFLKLSDNKVQLPNEGEYQVYLDKNTNYKHYFKNGVADIKMFFLNNGEYIGATDDEKKEEDSKEKKQSKFAKRFEQGLYTIVITVATATALLSGFCAINPEFFPNYFDRITMDEVRELIYSSELTNEQKNLLFNTDYYKDALPTINTSKYARTLFRERTNGLNIKYDEFDNDGSYDFGNTLHVNPKNKGTDVEDGIIVHEDLHKNQPGFSLFLIDETLPEIIKYEYNEDLPINAFEEHVDIVYELLEILGPKPFWYYNHTGYSDKIYESVEPYFSEQELEDFMNCLKFRHFYDSR